MCFGFLRIRNIVHVEGAPDAGRDREIVETELILSDLQTLNKQGEPKMNATKEDRARWELVKRLKPEMESGKLARMVITDPDERDLLVPLQLLTMKPIMYVANVSESQLSESVVIPAEAGIQSVNVRICV